MEPLTVEVNMMPSSSYTGQSPLPQKYDPDSYEVVNYSDINFPDFRRLKRLGRGSYGTVVECMFRGKPAAAKLVENGNDYSQIRSEAELLHGFRHKNIIKLYALFHGEMSGLVLELMEGRSLSELLHQHKHITYQTCHVLNWILQVCEALSYLHAHNFIHRDIKPSNMLLTRDYKTLKLCDFGTVAELKTSMTDNRGTAAWMAPEVFRGRRYDQKCDIFSLGISLWEMITRRQPFTDLNETNPVTLLWKVAENGLRPPKISDLPNPLMDLIERCWLNNPDERPCLEEVQKTIEAFIEIFPNANLLPLVDRTTAKQALAESSWDRLQYHPPPPPIPPISSGPSYYTPPSASNSTAVTPFNNQPKTIYVHHLRPTGSQDQSLPFLQIPQPNAPQPPLSRQPSSPQPPHLQYQQQPNMMLNSNSNGSTMHSRSMVDISSLSSGSIPQSANNSNFSTANGPAKYSPCLSPPVHAHPDNYIPNSVIAGRHHPPPNSYNYSNTYPSNHLAPPSHPLPRTISAIAIPQSGLIPPSSADDTISVDGKKKKHKRSFAWMFRRFNFL